MFIVIGYLYKKLIYINIIILYIFIASNIILVILICCFIIL